MSHASLAFDLNFNRIYSFNREGFTIEDRSDYINRINDLKIEIYTVIMHKRQSRNIEIRLDEWLARKNNTGYNYLGILGFAIGHPMKRNNKMFCSEFVDSMFKIADFDLTEKDSGLVAPIDFSKSKNKNIYKIYEGKMSNFNQIKHEKIVNKLLNTYINESSIITEVKEFPVQFDKDGNLLIKKINKLDYEQEYYKSHKLLEVYRRTDNLEGMKYELSKLWFILTILEDKIYNKKVSEENKQSFTKTRAKILNDFKSGLSYISNKDKTFNFIEYYNETPFSDAVYKIRKNTVLVTIDLLKSIVLK